jgi:SOS response regulatory protein OraA/RecX
LKNKGKSKNYIKQKFIENNFDKEKIEDFIEKIFDDDTEKNSIKNLLEKYNFNKKLDYKEKQKILEKIVRKGYNFSDILELMAE